MTLQDAANALQAEPRLIARAFVKARASAMRWAATQAAREFSSKSGLGISGARKRVKRKGDTIWFGGNPVNIVYLGAKKTGTGVAYKGGNIDGAFFIKGKKKAVFKRAGRARLPIIEQEAPIENAMNDVVHSDLPERTFDKLIEELKRLLKYD